MITVTVPHYKLYSLQCIAGTERCGLKFLVAGFDYFFLLMYLALYYTLNCIQYVLYIEFIPELFYQKREFWQHLILYQPLTGLEEMRTHTQKR